MCIYWNPHLLLSLVWGASFKTGESVWHPTILNKSTPSLTFLPRVHATTVDPFLVQKYDLPASRAHLSYSLISAKPPAINWSLIYWTAWKWLTPAVSPLRISLEYCYASPSKAFEIAAAFFISFLLTKKLIINQN